MPEGPEIRRALPYSASGIEVLDAAAERRHPFLSRLGPDVLSQAQAVEQLAARLAEPRFRGRQLGALLLDQSFVAGLGNYLRAEILFEAGIHPRRKAVECSVRERRRLANRTIALTKQTYRSLEESGATLEEGSEEEGRAIEGFQSLLSDFKAPDFGERISKVYAEDVFFNDTITTVWGLETFRNT